MKSKIMRKWTYGLLFVACMSLLTAGSALGAGFALIEQTASGMGNAMAGGAAIAEDATTIFFNPAGMTRLVGNQVILGAHVIIPTLEFEDEGSTHITGAPLNGGNGGDAGVTKVVPNFYYSRKLTERFAVGIGINAPFGLATEYDKGWVGRYQAIESDLLSVNINPSIAYKFNEHISVGVGASAQYIKAKLSKQIDFGSLYNIPGGLPPMPPGLGLIPQGSDGFGELDGDSWGFGYNIGFLYEFTKDTRIGLAYRSRIDHTLEGDVDYSIPPTSGDAFRNALASYHLFTSGDAEADVTLPDSLSLSFFHQINAEWIVMADVTWTNWQLFDKLVVEFDDSTPDDVTTENWQDSYRYSLGVTYLPSKNLALRLGTAYDTSAVSDKKYRTPRIPDADRIWTTAGLGYRISNMFSFDVGYAHLFINDPEISKTPTGEDALKGGLNGKFDASIDIISAQLNIAF